MTHKSLRYVNERGVSCGATNVCFSIEPLIKVIDKDVFLHSDVIKRTVNIYMYMLVGNDKEMNRPRSHELTGLSLINFTSVWPNEKLNVGSPTNLCQYLT